MANEEMVKNKLDNLKGSLVEIWGKFSSNGLGVTKQKFEDVRHRFDELLHSQRASSVTEESSDEEFRFNESTEEDLPLTIQHNWPEENEDDDSRGVRYSTTENNPLARDGEKVKAFGIDKFDEDDTFDPEEAEEHQSFQNRHQNSDLNKRFGIKGLVID